MVRFYGYAKCSTCRKAKQFLQAGGLALQDIDITTTPPSRALLESLVRSGGYQARDLVNRSGRAYRDPATQRRIKAAQEPELLELLASNGWLVKRPIVTDGTRYTVGFDEARMRQAWRSRRA
jgi:arsenate reductase